MIFRRTSDPGGLHPEARATLSALFIAPSRHVALGFRPPQGAYSGSIQDVIFAFESALNAVDDFRSKRPWLSNQEHWDRHYVQAFEHLLYTLVEHVDTCSDIVRCHLPGDVEFKKHPVFKKWDQDIRFYRSRVATIVNSIKHRQRRLRGIVMHDDAETVPGYYVEIVGTGSENEPMAHPDTLIHREGNTAISGYRDLRFHFVHLYVLGQHLSNALGWFATTGNDGAGKSNTDPRLFQVAMRISELPAYCFPDEVAASAPAVGAGEDSSGIRTIWVEYPSARVRPIALTTPRFSISFTGDGASRSFKTPYAALGVSGSAVDRNDPCPCGSGLKWKKCHGRTV
jgi:hypothetical protein